MYRNLTLTFCLFFTTFLFGQSIEFQTKSLEIEKYDAILDKEFYNYHLYRLDQQAIHQFVQSSDGEVRFNLKLGKEYDWNLSLYPHDMRSPDYLVYAQTENGLEIQPKRPNMTYRGYLEADHGGVAGFTINEHHFAGTVKLNDQLYFVDPLHYLIKDAPKDLVVVYAVSDVKPDEGLTCGADEYFKKSKENYKEHADHDHAESSSRSVGLCLEVELAIANDWLMYLDYNQSETEVEDHNITVMNNVGTNWDNEFEDEIVFVIVTHFISTCSSCDPWTSSTNAGTLLSSFRNWGNGGGFGVSFDLGQLWTDRNLNGSTIGIAYLSGLCTTNKYHVCQDFTTNQQQLRVLTSHEIGHNFSSFHDNSGGFIMSPSVNTSNTWSTQSQNAINSFITQRYNQGGCFSECIEVVPPEPDFLADQTSGCIPLNVQFTDLSANAPTSWSWSFPGGTPASSIEQNPSVTYNSAGVYDVTLTATNSAGENSITKFSYISVLDIPVPGFTFSIINDIVEFQNTTQNGGSYLWDFGDGSTSNAVNPTHFYAEDGFYTVTLTATNICGTETYTEVIEVATLPEADFTSNVTEGCVPLIVSFEDLSSSNTDVWLWSFPGASPDQSTDQNPTVIYENPGTFDVTLTVLNEVGSNTLHLQNYITVNPLPSPDFTFIVNGTTVDFTNTSTNANSYLWDFGDGNTSVEENPSHTYDSGGDYTVVLSVTNDCGTTTTVQIVQIEAAPTAGIGADVLSGCAPLTVQFLDNSSPNVDTWEWSFPGGDPSSSTLQNPVVVYNTAGLYTVTLTVTNAAGSSTVTETDYIEVNDVPVAGFSSLVNDLTVDFTNSSTNADTYSWDFGDGNSSGEENPSHTYGMDGEYIVVLTATNECGSVTTEQTVTIVTAPTAGFSANVTSGCAELTVQFSDESTANATSWEWTFAGGTPSSSSEENPVVVYNSTGVYTVTLTVSNAAGSSTVTETDYIEVNDVPVAGFSSLVNDLTVDFTNSSTNADTYSWDFGDGNSSGEENPSHTYGMDGEYIVVLTATNECGSVTTEQTVTIVTAPTAGFSANVTSGCAELTVQFSDESTANATSWEWTFAGGTPSSSSEENPVVVYNSAGVYTVTLTVSNTAGSSTVTETDYIEVNDVPVAGFSSLVNDLTVDFTNSSTNADTYSWDFGDGNSSSEENPSHTYGDDGEYTVVLTATNECGSVSTEQTITIVTAPTAGFSANVTSGCAELTVEFSDESTANATSWEWTFAGGTPSSSSEENPVVVYNSAGVYTVTLTVSNAAGSNTVTETDYIVVNDVPVAGFNSVVNDATVDFTNSSTNADTYSWDFGDGNSSSEENPSHTYGMDGEYTVVLTATNECGSVETTQVINIGTLPTAAFTADVTSGCAPLTVQFTDQSSANTNEWDWSFEGGTPATSALQNPEIVFEQPGIYTVTLTAINDSGTNTSTQVDYIVVNTVPNVGFNSNTNGTITDFTNTSTNATSFSWDFGDGNTSSEENPEHDYQTDGEYTVVLTATNECGSTTSSEVITIVTAPIAGFNSDITSGCAPLTVQFNDQSSPNTTSWNWTFEGGNPASSSEQNPEVTFATQGSYSVTLEVSNAAGSSEITETAYIVVNDVPLANFTFISAGPVTVFSNTSTNSTSVSWDFGDGNSSTEENPSHTYATDGDFDVTLTATNECGTTTITQTVTAVIAPVSGFSANVTTGCTPLTVQFEDQSSGVVDTYNWTFPGGNPSSSNAENPVVVYDTPGMYSVELEVSNSAGSNTASQTNYIIVNTVPTVGFTGVVAGTSVTFTNISTGATGYHWDFGDGTSSEDTNPSHDFGTDGTYTVTLTAENECGTVTFMETFEIVTEPLAGFTADITTGCADLIVNFMDQSSGNTTSWEWTFEGGDPATSSEQNPTVLYDTPGSYNVTLVATTSAGSNSYTQNQFIIVNTVPTVDFSTTINGATVNFVNNSTGATSYLWDFGDGNISTMPNPEYTYPDDGDYTVTLTAINDCGEVTTTQTISVVSFPVASFMADVTLGCGPLTVNYTDMSTGNVSDWNWTFSGGNPGTSTVQNPVVEYTNPGTYSVTLEVTNSAGTDVQTIVSYITVESIPIPDFNATITGATAIFTNTSSGGTTFSWDFGDGNTSTEENPFHIYSEDGTYTVTFTVSNSCGTMTTTQEILIITAPSALFTADTLSGCAPIMVQFIDQSSSNTANWNWTFEGGTPSTSTEQNPIVTYNQPGTFDVTLLVSNAGGNNTSIEVDFITIGTAPTADFSSMIDGASVDFTNLSMDGDTYEWNFGDGELSTEEHPVHQYQGAGDFVVTLTVTNACGSTTIMQTISIVGEAPVAVFAADNTTGCVPFTVNFEDNSTGTPTAWSWTFTGGNPAGSNDQNPTVTYESAGTFAVALTVTNDFGENTVMESEFIVVQDIPTAGFEYNATQNGTVEFTNISSDATSYEWDFGDGGMSTEENPNHQFMESGTYTVVLTATNACGSVTTEEIIMVLITGLEGIENIDVFKLYPNPNNGEFTLILEGTSTDNLQFRLFNVLGQKIYHERLDYRGGSWSKTYEFDDLASGTYFVQLQSEGKVLYKKVIIE